MQTPDDLRRLRLLTFTPTVGPGVSFEPEGLFHVSAPWGGPRLPVVDDAHLQRVGRVRWVGDPSGERVLLAHLPARESGASEHARERTSRSAVAQDWREMAEAEQRRTGAAVREPHPVLDPLRLAAESQSRTDRAAFVQRMFDEMARAGYAPTADYALRRIPKVEEASAAAACEADRVDQVKREVAAMLHLEACEAVPWALHLRLRDRRHARAPLSDDDKRYLAMFTSVHGLGFRTLSDVPEGFALALWGVARLADEVHNVRAFEVGRPTPGTTSATPRSMSPFARDAALRDLLAILGLAGLHDSSPAFDGDAPLSVANREVLVQLAGDYKDKFHAELVNEEKLRAKLENRRPLAPSLVEVPSPCAARLALAFANVLLVDMGLKMKVQTVEVEGEGRRKRARGAACLQIEPDRLAFAYAVLTATPNGMSAATRERMMAYLELHPVDATEGLERLERSLVKKRERLDKLREKMDTAFAHLRTGEGYRRWAAQSPPPPVMPQQLSAPDSSERERVGLRHEERVVLDVD